MEENFNGTNPQRWRRLSIFFSLLPRHFAAPLSQAVTCNRQSIYAARWLETLNLIIAWNFLNLRKRVAWWISYFRNTRSTPNVQWIITWPINFNCGRRQVSIQYFDLYTSRQVTWKRYMLNNYTHLLGHLWNGREGDNVVTIMVTTGCQ